VVTRPCTSRRSAASPGAPFRARDVAAHHEPLDGGAVVLAAREFAGLATVAEHGHPVGDPHHLVEMVRHEDDGHARAPQLVEDPEQALGLVHREARGRLVEDQDARLGRERLRDLDELPLGDAEGAAERPGIDREPDAREPLRALRAHLRAVEEPEARRLAPEVDRARDIEVLREVQLLVDERDARVARRAHAVERDLSQRAARRSVGHREHALARLHHAREDLEKRRLPCAVLADDRQHLAAAHLEVDARKRHDARVAAADAAHGKDHRAHGLGCHFASLPALIFALRSFQKLSALSLRITLAGMLITPSSGTIDMSPFVNACSTRTLSKP
jgi:hypothetical protein